MRSFLYRKWCTKYRKIGYKGFIRKAGIMIVVIIANLLDLLVTGGMPVFRSMAVYFYIGLEGLSIRESGQDPLVQILVATTP